MFCSDAYVCLLSLSCTLIMGYAKEKATKSRDEKWLRGKKCTLGKWPNGTDRGMDGHEPVYSCVLVHRSPLCILLTTPLCARFELQFWALVPTTLGLRSPRLMSVTRTDRMCPFFFSVPLHCFVCSYTATRLSSCFFCFDCTVPLGTVCVQSRFCFRFFPRT